MKKASKPKNDLTLKNIGDLLEQKIDQKLAPIFDEFKAVRRQISEGDNNLELKIDTLGKEMKEGFNTVCDGLETLGKDNDFNLEPRIKRLEDQRLFAV